MKFTKEEFNKEVDRLYNGEVEVLGHFKGIAKPILIKDKYGILEYKQARQVLNNKPSISSALNKTEYFMNMLKDVHPEIYFLIKPLSEYKSMKEKMIFKTQYGEVSISPDSLLHGHLPNIRSAVNRKDYFKNQLMFLYDGKYDFEVTTSDRHGGKSKLICPIHGEVIVDNDWIMQGNGCYKCNQTSSNIFYLIKLSNDIESFYKLGISYLKDGVIRRYKDYEKLGYTISEIKTIHFDEALKCREFETKLKKIIKPYLITPENWDYETSTECFKTDLLDIFINSYINNDIV